MLLIAVLDALIMRTYHKHCYRQTMRKTLNMSTKDVSRAVVAKQIFLKSSNRKFLWCDSTQIACPRIFMTNPQILHFQNTALVWLKTVLKVIFLKHFFVLYKFELEIVWFFFVRRKGRYLRTSGSFKPKKRLESANRKSANIGVTLLDGRYNIWNVNVRTHIIAMVC